MAESTTQIIAVKSFMILSQDFYPNSSIMITRLLFQGLSLLIKLGRFGPYSTQWMTCLLCKSMRVAYGISIHKTYSTFLRLTSRYRISSTPTAPPASTPAEYQWGQPAGRASLWQVRKCGFPYATLITDRLFLFRCERIDKIWKMQNNEYFIHCCYRG